MDKSIINNKRNVFILIFLILLSLSIFGISQVLIFKNIGILLDDIVYVEIPSAVFSFFIGSFFCLGILIGMVFVSLMKAWTVLELVDRIENPIFADQVKFWINMKIKQNGWNEFIEDSKKEGGKGK